MEDDKTYRNVYYLINTINSLINDGYGSGRHQSFCGLHFQWDEAQDLLKYLAFLTLRTDDRALDLEDFIGPSLDSEIGYWSFVGDNPIDLSSYLLRKKILIWDASISSNIKLGTLVDTMRLAFDNVIGFEYKNAGVPGEFVRINWGLVHKVLQ